MAYSKERVEKTLDRYLPRTKLEPKELHKAMRYSVLNGGKRIRACFIYAMGEALGAQHTKLDPVAAAIECIHAATLVHDDLPAMDNDDMRRGKPSCHKMFGEATAILVGDALILLAFEILADNNSAIPTQQRLTMVAKLAHALGSFGVIGGQTNDLAATRQTVSIKKLFNIHWHKTADLIVASLQLAALAAEITDTATLNHLEKFAKYLGVAFQIQDDILDTKSSDDLAKLQQPIMSESKANYPALLGVEAAKQRAEFWYKRAMTNLDNISVTDTSMLKSLCQFLMHREN